MIQIFYQYNIIERRNKKMNDSPMFTSMFHTCHVKPIVLNVSKKILNRESIFRQPNPLLADQFKKSSKMTNEQVINSQIYCRLVDRMADLKQSIEDQANQHEQNMKIMAKLINIGKEKVHQIKYDVWEMKNEMMELEEILQEEIQENRQIEDEWRKYDQSSGDEQEQEINSSAEESEMGEQAKYSSEEASKVSCSIRNMIPPEDNEELVYCNHSEPVVRTFS